MRITELKTYKFSVPTGQGVRDPETGELLCSAAKPWLFLKLETDAGISGWGEGSGEWLVPPVEATLHSWRELIVGRDPLPAEALCEDILNRLPWKGGPVLGTAIAAVNAALFDIAGRSWGVPVPTILGGPRRHRVRVYSGIPLDEPEQAADAAVELQEQGYAGAKGNPLETRTWPLDHAAISRSVRCVAAVRDATGPEFSILLDAHGSPTPELGLELARQLSPYAPLLLEEPVKTGSVEALLTVSRSSPVPIAVGEKLFSLGEFLPLVQRRACAFLQPDLTHCGGLSGTLEIARAAATAQMLMAPHNAGGPLALAATLALDAVTPNFLIQEMNQAWFARFGDFVEHDWQISDGHINVSTLPGLGVEVKEADIQALDYSPLPYRQYRHGDGSWKGW
jgi:galactonate dehydratase